VHLPEVLNSFGCSVLTGSLVQ